jgi:hypothetical protein
MAVPLVAVGVAAAADEAGGRGPGAFRALKAMSPDAARERCLEWLNAVGKADEATQKQFEAIWARADEPVLDRVTASLALGEPEAARLLAGSVEPTAAAPTEIPALLRDEKRPLFFRANLGLAYARALSNRRVYEEALAVLRRIKATDVVDPAAYFFHRAVAEHALALKRDASRSLVGLLEDVSAAPERYRMVGMLMQRDMESWKDKDLGDIARKMGNIERRLELARGGPQTQKIERDVLARLDELIKRLENPPDANGGS